MHPEQSTSPPDFGPPSRIADFTVIKPLSRDGSFVLATPPQRLQDAGSPVALKVYPVDAADDQREAMRRVSEVLRAMAAVRSPYLVRLIEVGQNDGLIYCAMEHLSGGSLAAPASQLTFAEVLRAVACAARGAHDLHEHGLAHRNIHPGGVILHADGAQLADPDLASCVHPGLAITARRPQPHLGFVAPDLLRGHDPSRASDLFSLGATLHYAASGRGLYPTVDESDPVSALPVITASRPQVAAGIPGPIDDIIRQCIDPAHPNRPRTAGDLADRLDSIWKR